MTTGVAYTAAQLAALALPGLPKTKRNINVVAARELWDWRPRKGQGGGREYLVSSLPGPARAALAQRQLEIHSTSLSPPATGRVASDLKSHQSKRMEARASVLALVDHLVQIEGHTRSKAIEAVVARARAGALPPVLQDQIATANARSNAMRTLTRATLFNWLAARDRAGGDIVGLAPAAPAEAPIPLWAATFLSLYARPSKPGIAEILDDPAWRAAPILKPSYDQARRFLKRLSAIDRNRGRLGPRALKALKAYVVRDVENLWPGAVFIGDGHTYKAEVAHPDHGRPFRPEITAILDVYTRRWVGWSAALAENTWSVADALRHAVTGTTCCDVFYYDNGAGAKNEMWDADAIGLIARLCITKLHSAPWSSQARGIIERFHSTVLHKSARQLPTYVGARMDKEARQSVFKLTRADIKASGLSNSLISWPKFLAKIEADRIAYNARPHSFLPRIVDLATGKRRNQSPDEAWQSAIDAGWSAEPIGEIEARDLFRPHELRQVNRATVKLHRNLYFSPALEPFHGDTVIVAFDVHDPEHVQVRMTDGRFICDELWTVHKSDYLPVPFAQHLRDKRVQGRLNRLDAHRDEVLAEATPNLRLVADAAEPAPAEIEAQRDYEARFAARAEQQDDGLSPEEREEVAAKQRYIRALKVERARNEGADIGEIDTAWYRHYATTSEYQSWRSFYGDGPLAAEGA